MSDPIATAARLPDGTTPDRSRALEALFRRYRPVLYSYFLRRTGHSADAEDLTQDVFIRLSRADPSLEMRHSDAFVFRIASNLLRDRARHDRVHQAVIQPLEEDFDAVSTEPSAERVLQGRRELDEVVRTLSSLSDRTRNIFMLRRFEQMKCEEIAACYGISVNAVEQHIRKALAHLTRTSGTR